MFHKWSLVDLHLQLLVHHSVDLSPSGLKNRNGYLWEDFSEVSERVLHNLDALALQTGTTGVTHLLTYLETDNEEVYYLGLFKYLAL